MEEYLNLPFKVEVGDRVWVCFKDIDGKDLTIPFRVYEFDGKLAIYGGTKTRHIILSPSNYKKLWFLKEDMSE